MFTCEQYDRPYLYPKSHTQKASRSDRTFYIPSYLISREWDLLLPANRRSKPFVPFHNLSPSPQSAIHFQSHDPVIANGPLSTETRICVFLSLNPRRAPVRLRWMRLGVKQASRAGRISVLEKQLFFYTKKSKSTFFLPHWWRGYKCEHSGAVTSSGVPLKYSQFQNHDVTVPIAKSKT